MISWHFGSSLYWFFYGLLAIISFFVYLITQEHFFEEADEPIPLEIFDFTYYQFEKGRISLEANALYAYRDMEQKEHATHFSVTEYQENGDTNFIYASKIQKQDEWLDFPEGIAFVQTYANKDSWYLWSKNGIYDSTNRIFEGRGDFFLQDDRGSSMQGQNLWYNYDLGLISGDKIQGSLIFKE